MRSLQTIRSLMQEFKPRVDILFVYIEEIHAADGWSFKSNKFKINQHKTIEDRFDAAQMLQDTPEFDFPLVVDTMQNEANYAFGAIPERLVVIDDDKVKYLGGVGPYYFDVDEMRNYLINILK